MASRVVAAPLVEAHLSMGQKGEWEDAGGFTAQIEQGEEIWRGWCGGSSW